ncbi:MAG: hypothetical protein Q4B86_02170 [Eubacteriales bacterium]|nr:hypothetical protein [Eubacteriales bacterium]
MLKPNKIRLMTELAIYEKNRKRDVFDISNFYENDYIAGQLFSSFVRYTICAAFVFTLYVFLNSEFIFTKINVDGAGSVFLKSFVAYIIGLAFYMMITYFVSTKRYKNARRGMLLYASKLKRLGRKYEDMAKVKRDIK